MLPFATLPADDRGRMLALGPKYATDIRKHRDLVLSTYAPLVQQSSKEGITVIRDVAYGPHKRNTVDVFFRTGVVNAPVVAFVHGGAFTRGDKILVEGIYDNVLFWFARLGYLAINVEYRLAPEFPFPNGALDVAAATHWIRDHGRQYGGDPSTIFLVGHSAGAAHICGYVLDPAVEAKPGSEIAGLVLLSGRLKIDALPENPNAGSVRAYYGDREEQYDARSATSHADSCRYPVMIGIAEYENPLLDVYSLEFCWRIAAAKQKAPRFVQMRHHNHASMIMHFDTGEEILGNEIVDFMRSVKAT